MSANKRLLLLLGLALTALAARSLPAPRIPLKLTPTEATIRFTLPAYPEVEGFAGGLKAEILLDPAAPEKSEIHASVQVNTFHTGDEDLDAYIQGENYLHAAQYPEVFFTAQGVVPGPQAGDFEAAGELGMHGKVLPLRLPFHWGRMESAGLLRGSMDLDGVDWGVFPANGKPGQYRVHIDLNVAVQVTEKE